MERYENIAENISIYGASSIAEKIINVYNKDKIDRVELFYTDCKSPLVQEAQRLTVIPVEIDSLRKSLKSSVVQMRRISARIYNAVWTAFIWRKICRISEK